MRTGIRDQGSGVTDQRSAAEVAELERLYSGSGVAELELAPWVEYCSACGKPTEMRELDEPLCMDCHDERQRARSALKCADRKMTLLEWTTALIGAGGLIWCALILCAWVLRYWHLVPGVR